MFHFSLIRPSHGLPEGFEADEIEDESDYEYLTVYACSLLAETDCKFLIGGFGQDDWSFDISYDMSSFVEELPNLLKGLRERREVVIYLYSQGVERILTFTPHDEIVKIRCVSQTDWVPSPSEENVSRGELLRMAQALARDFRESLNDIAPTVARMEPIAQISDL